MVKLWQSKGPYCTRFFAPDNGDGSGGGGAATASGGSGEPAADPVTPFDDIDLDELDEATRNKIVDGKKQYIATLQRTTKLNADLEHTQALARRFQGEADKAKAEYEKITGKGKSTATEEDPILAGIRADLKASGYADDLVDKMAPTFLRMFSTFGASLKKSIGTDLSPLASTVLEGAATTAFEQARDNDPLGMLQVPEVAEKTWGLVQERIKGGQTTTPAIVANLAKMAFMDHAAERASKGEIVELKPSAASPTKGNMNTSFTFPGSGAVRPTLPANNTNQPEHALNEDTQNALATTFAEMGRGTGVYPKSFPAGSKKGGRK